MGKIPEGYLPPRELWPTRIWTLPEHRTYPQRLNSTEELLDKQVAAGKGDRPAMLFEDRKLPYKALLGMVNRVGSSLKALGIDEGDRVALRAPNIPPALVVNFAVLKIGGIFLPTSGLLSRAEIAHVFNNAEVKAVVVAAPLLEELEKAKPDLKTLEHIIVIGGTPEQQAQYKRQGYLPYQELLDGGKPECDPVRRDRMDVSVLIYTSGTTGPPKGTAHFMEEALIVPDSFGKYCRGVTESDVILSAAPMAMAAGYSAAATIPYRFGAAASIFARFRMMPGSTSGPLDSTRPLPSGSSKVAYRPHSSSTGPVMSTPAARSRSVSASTSGVCSTSPRRLPGGMVANQVTSVSAVWPPFGATWTHRWSGPIGLSATRSKPSVST